MALLRVANVGVSVVVDDDAVEELRRHRWTTRSADHPNPIRLLKLPLPGTSPLPLRLAEHLLGPASGVKFVHVNGNPYDFRRGNLKAVPDDRFRRLRSR